MQEGKLEKRPPEPLLASSWCPFSHLSLSTEAGSGTPCLPFSQTRMSACLWSCFGTSLVPVIELQTKPVLSQKG